MDQQHTDTGPLCWAQTDFENRIAKIKKRALTSALHLTNGNRDEAEDLVQKATVKAWGAFASFDRVRNFQTWFLRIIVNLFIDNRKRKSRNDCSLDAYAEDANSALAITDSDLEERLIREEAAAGVQKALEALPEKQREVILLTDFECLSHAEVAEILKIPMGTMRSRKFRAMKALRKLLVNHAPPDPE